MRRGTDDYREHLIVDEGDEAPRHDREGSAEDGWSSRAVPSDFNYWPHVFNLTNCIVGVSVLAMPYCLQQCGILLGTVLIGLCSYLTKLTCHVLYKGAVMTRTRSYPAYASHALGSGGQRLVEVLMLLFLMSSCVSFMVVIGDVGPHALADYLQLQAPTQRLRVLVMVFVLLFIILPLSMIKNLDSLSVVSSITVLFYCIFVVRMLIESVPRLFDGKWTLDVHWWRQEGILTSLPIIAMALSCQTQLFDIAGCVKDSGSRKVDMIVSGAVNICSGIYAAVGLFGYVAFHDIALHGDILLYLQSTVLTQFLKIGFMLSIAVSVPLMLFPCRTTIYNFLRKDSEYLAAPMSTTSFLATTIGLLFTTFLIAVFIPNVEFVLGLTGALIGSTVTIIIPSFLFIQVCDTSRRNRWLVLGAKIAALAGIFMLVCSTWAVLHTEQEATVVDVIQPKQPAVTEPDSDYLMKAGISAELFKGDLPDRSNETLQNVMPDVVKGDQAKAKTKEEIELGEAKQLLEEIKKQQKEQGKIIKEQQAIVQQLNKHHELHEHAKQDEIPDRGQELKREAKESEKDDSVKVGNEQSKDAQMKQNQAPQKGNNEPQIETPPKENNEPQVEAPPKGDNEPQVEAPPKENNEPKVAAPPKENNEPNVGVPAKEDNKPRVETLQKDNNEQKIEGPRKENIEQKIEAPRNQAPAAPENEKLDMVDDDGAAVPPKEVRVERAAPVSQNNRTITKGQVIAEKANDPRKDENAQKQRVVETLPTNQQPEKIAKTDGVVKDSKIRSNFSVKTES